LSLTFTGTDDRLPLYAQLRDALAAQIASQVWPSGAMIPPEHELAKQFGVSVHTLRRAVQQLVDEGLLDRRQGSGTYVRRPSFDGSLFRWFNFVEATGAPKTVPESRLLSRTLRPALPHVAAGLGLAPGSEIIHVLRLRLWSGEPMVVEELHLPYPKCAAFLTVDEQEIGPLLYPAYERLLGEVVASVIDEVSIGYANDEVAQLLHIAQGDPVAHVDRASRRADATPIEWRRAYGRADRFRYRVTL